MYFAANILGFFIAKWRIIAVFAGILVLLFCVALLWKRCNPPPKISEPEIFKAEKAYKEGNDAELKQVLARSDVAADNVDANIKLAEERTRQAEKNYDGWTADQMMEEARRRANQQ